MSYQKEERLVSLDWAMKRLLRSKSNFVILEGFLTELILKKENDQIKDEKIKSEFKAKGMDKAVKTLNLMKLERAEKIRYDRYIDNRRYEMSIATTKELDLKYSREDGVREGEKKAKIEIAKSLLDVLDIETISIKTGLSVEEIEKLKSK